MLNLNNDVIKKFTLPNTINIIMLNGIYQPELSNKTHYLNFSQNNLQIPENFKSSLPIKILFLYTKIATNCSVISPCSAACEVQKNYNLINKSEEAKKLESFKLHNSEDILSEWFNIKIEQNNNCVILEEHIDLDSKDSKMDIAINITIADNSSVAYYKIQNQGGLSNRNAKTIINQYKNSQVKYYFLGKGVDKSCDILQINMLKEYSNFDALGVIILNKSQILNYNIDIEHLSPNCFSNILFKGIVDDNAIGDFSCKALVHSNSYNTQTHVVNKNLLLSKSAIMNTKPSMEIYNNDVNGTHGATVGQLDQDAILYMRCRGILYTQAVELLTKAFTQDIIEKFTEYLQPNEFYYEY